MKILERERERERKNKISHIYYKDLAHGSGGQGFFMIDKKCFNLISWMKKNGFKCLCLLLMNPRMVFLK